MSVIFCVHIATKSYIFVAWIHFMFYGHNNICAFFLFLVYSLSKYHLVYSAVIPLSSLPLNIQGHAYFINNYKCFIMFCDLIILLQCWKIVIRFYDRLTGKMKGNAFKQFQLLWETSMLCIHWCYPIHLVKDFYFTRENWWMTMLKRTTMVILVWTHACLPCLFIILDTWRNIEVLQGYAFGKGKDCVPSCNLGHIRESPNRLYRLMRIDNYY